VRIETQCEEDKECGECEKNRWSRQLGRVTYGRHLCRIGGLQCPDKEGTRRKGAATPQPFQKPRKRLMLIGPLLFHHACILPTFRALVTNNSPISSRGTNLASRQC